MFLISQAITLGIILTKFILVDGTSEFLTNAPTTQYANLEDYGTLSIVTTNMPTLYQNKT
jgi:hypothetical protein